MLDQLTSYIQSTGGEGYTYGFSDCAPWVARWVERATGRKVPFPMYRSRKQSLQVVKDAGGMTALFSDLAAQVGLKATLAPQRGDIGLLVHPQALHMQLLAICLGNGKWAGKVITGEVSTFSGRVVKAWSVQ